MVNETGSGQPGRSGLTSSSGETGAGAGFSAGTVLSSFAGALGALLVAGATMSLWWPEQAAPSAPGTATPAREAQSLQIPAEGVEEFVHISGMATSITLGFDEAGTYRIELRALDGASDPVLTLFAAGSDTPSATNDDAPGTLDSILPVRVADVSDTWRLELTSFGESGGPGVLRIFPVEEGEVIGVTTTTGPGAFPEGDIAVLNTAEPVEASVGYDGVWYTFQPTSSGVHVLSIRAAEDGFDTIAALVPVLAGNEAPMPGTDVTVLRSAFSSDDDDGLNPRFARYLQEGATYYLFVRSFEDGAEGSIAISLDLAGDDVPAAMEHPEEEDMIEEHVDPVDPSSADDQSGGGKLNVH